MPITKADVEGWSREKLEEQYYLLRGMSLSQGRALAALGEKMGACPGYQYLVLKQHVADTDEWLDKVRELLGNPVCGIEHEIKRLQKNQK